jgi:hypothetical protein
MTRDQSRLVEENTPEAAWLLAGKGQEIPREAVKRLGLVMVRGRVEQASQVMERVLAEPVAEEPMGGQPFAYEMPELESEPDVVEPIMPSESRRRRRRN